MSDPTEPRPTPQGAILSDDQIRKLRLVVIAMSVVLVAGVATLVGRIVYLANRGNDLQPAQRLAMRPEQRLALPSGAVLKSATLSGDRLAAHYGSPAGDGVIVHDLATGAVLTHVRVVPAP